jgi:hypothetical protein
MELSNSAFQAPCFLVLFMHATYVSYGMGGKLILI